MPDAHRLEDAIGKRQTTVACGDVTQRLTLLFSVHERKRICHRTCSTEGGTNASASSPGMIQGAESAFSSSAPSARDGSDSSDDASPRRKRSSIAYPY